MVTLIYSRLLGKSQPRPFVHPGSSGSPIDLLGLDKRGPSNRRDWSALTFFSSGRIGTEQTDLQLACYCFWIGPQGTFFFPPALSCATCNCPLGISPNPDPPSTASRVASRVASRASPHRPIPAGSSTRLTQPARRASLISTLQQVVRRDRALCLNPSNPSPNHTNLGTPD